MRLRWPSLRDILDLFLSDDDTDKALRWLDKAIDRLETASARQAEKASRFFDEEAKHLDEASRKRVFADRALANSNRANKVAQNLKNLGAK